MEMNKTKIAMCAIGAVAAVVSLAIAALAFAAAGDRDEHLESLEGLRSRRNRNAGASVETENAAKANTEKIRQWAETAYAAEAKAGARPDDAAGSPVAFKSQMVEQAREFAKLQGTAEGTGKIVKDDFGFGFDAFVKASAIPKEAELPVLQRQWFDVMHFLKMAQAAGAGEILAVSVARDSGVQPEESVRRGRQREQAVNPYPVSEQKYVFKMHLRPAALVKLVNSLAADDRFYAIDAISFEQEGDPLAVVIGENKEKEQPARRGRRGRRISRQETEEAFAEGGANAPAKKGLVTDPASCAPFTVAMQVSTLEFPGKAKTGNTEDGK